MTNTKREPTLADRAALLIGSALALAAMLLNARREAEATDAALSGALEGMG